MKIIIIKSIVFVLTCAIIFILIMLINSITAEKNIISKDIETNISINQPQGSNIKNVLAKDDYLYIVVSDGKLSDRIVILNTKNGEIISTVSLN